MLKLLWNLKCKYNFFLTTLHKKHYVYYLLDLLKKNFKEKTGTLSILLFNTPTEKNFLFLLKQYFQIWPAFQWATSILTLVLIYWISGYFYNKFLSHKGGWMDTKTRIFMIFVDLMLNFIFGIYYMNYRNTFIGALMIQCPVFLSPLFWIIELVCFYIYYRQQFDSKKKIK